MMDALLKFFIAGFLFVGTSSYALEIVPKQICSPNECYTILKKLGEGVFGEVFAVENSKGIKFALKTFKDTGSHPYNDPKREFRVGQILNHPNIIKSFEFFSCVNYEGENTDNLILQLVNGQVLHKIGRGKLLKSEALHAAITLCNALKYAHSMDLIHVDLHHSNLMLDEKFGIMVIDLASFFSPEEFFELFGITESHSSSFFKIRSPISKEQIKKNQVFLLKPHLFKVIKNVKEKVAQQEKRERMMLFDVSTNDSSYSFKMTKVLIQQNFHDIVEMCNNLIKKSDLPWEEKKELMKNIIEFSWNYEEDMAEGTSQPISYYFDALTDYLREVNYEIKI